MDTNKQKKTTDCKCVKLISECSAEIPKFPGKFTPENEPVSWSRSRALILPVGCLHICPSAVHVYWVSHTHEGSNFITLIHCTFFTLSKCTCAVYATLSLGQCFHMPNNVR